MTEPTETRFPKTEDNETPGAKDGRHPRWIWRAVFLTVPLHLTVFTLLYFGGARLVEREMLQAHSADSRMLLGQAVDDLHLTMRLDAETDVAERLTRFAESHADLNLRIFDTAGDAVTRGDVPEAEVDDVQALLASEENERFWMERGSLSFLGLGSTGMRGMLKVHADERCQPCHTPGEMRGVASMSRDLTDQVKDLRRRLAFWVLLGLVTWVAIALVVNRTLVKAGARSAARVEADIAAFKQGSDVRPQPGTRMLDPVSASLFESLSRALESQRQREQHLAKRMHHADRLASLGSLAAGLAHEIKNPLAGIQGALEILRDEDPEENENRDVFEQMLAELKRVDATIRTLLRFGRPSPPRRAPTDVKDLLEDTVSLLRPGLLRRSVSLELETAPEIGSFSLDSEQMRQVIVNLISNAVEAMVEDPDRSGGRVTVRATTFPASQVTGEDGIILAVEDDGPGIPEDEQTKIFQPFFSTKFSGTGLGLAVVESLVSQHGGRVELESRPGHGSTFFVILPSPSGE